MCTLNMFTCIGISFQLMPYLFERNNVSVQSKATLTNCISGIAEVNEHIGGQLYLSHMGRAWSEPEVSQ